MVWRDSAFDGGDCQENNMVRSPDCGRNFFHRKFLQLSYITDFFFFDGTGFGFNFGRYNLRPALHLKSKSIMAKWPSSILTHLTNMMKLIFFSWGVVTLLYPKYLT